MRWGRVSYFPGPALNVRNQCLLYNWHSYHFGFSWQYHFKVSAPLALLKLKRFNNTIQKTIILINCETSTLNRVSISLRPINVPLLPVTRLILKKMFKFADPKLFQYNCVYYRKYYSDATEKLLWNRLTFINRNIIPVPTWLTWTSAQLLVRMNMFDWIRIVFSLKWDTLKAVLKRKSEIILRGVVVVFSWEYFRTVLFLVCVLFMSTFTGSRSLLICSLYEIIIVLPNI